MDPQVPTSLGESDLLQLQASGCRGGTWCQLSGHFPRDALCASSVPQSPPLPVPHMQFSALPWAIKGP